MNLLKRHVLFIALISLIAIAGCTGGGSSAPVTKDVAGINATISGFMASIANRDSVAASKFLANETADSSVHSLMIYDFGSDINDPNDDRRHYQFTVQESDIIQLSDSIATVKATYNLQSGQMLCLTFALIKQSGVWTIETIDVGESNTDSASSFVASTYFPVVPGAVAKYNCYYYEHGSNIQTEIYTRTFASSPIELNGIEFYQLLENYEDISGTYTYDENYFSNQTDGLWTYSSTSNNGEPFKILEASHAFGSSHTVQYTTSEQSNSINHTLTLSFGYPEIVLTDMGEIQAVPVTVVETIDYGGNTSVYKSKSWFAANIGEVLYEEYMNSTDSTPIYSEKIFQYTRPSVLTTPSHDYPNHRTSLANVVQTPNPSAPLPLQIMRLPPRKYKFLHRRF